MSIDDLFMHAYIRNNFSDPHKVFAMDTGMSRAEAKEYVYKVLHESEFLQTWKQNVKD